MVSLVSKAPAMPKSPERQAFAFAVSRGWQFLPVDS